jgi:hypothetical protein
VENLLFFIGLYRYNFILGVYTMKAFINAHKVNIAILLFLALFSIIHITKPTIIYNADGGFRPFGVGYRHKTVIPIWGVAIVLAIFSYLAVLVYLQNFL